MLATEDDACTNLFEAPADISDKDNPDELELEEEEKAMAEPKGIETHRSSHLCASFGIVCASGATWCCWPSWGSST